MRMTMTYHGNLVALIDFVAKKTGWSDTFISRECFGYGDFTSKLRKWTGGTNSPTMEKCGKLEAFLLDQLKEAEITAFMKTRNVAPRKGAE